MAARQDSPCFTREAAVVKGGWLVKIWTVNMLGEMICIVLYIYTHTCVYSMYVYTCLYIYIYTSIHILYIHIHIYDIHTCYMHIGI